MAEQDEAAGGYSWERVNRSQHGRRNTIDAVIVAASGSMSKGITAMAEENPRSNHGDTRAVHSGVPGVGGDESAWHGACAPEFARNSLSLELQLELVDRVRALEAELAQISHPRSLSATEQLDAEKLLLELRNSLPWRVGRILTMPLRVAQRTVRRIRSR